MINDKLFILQAIFDIAIVIYILLSKHFESKDKGNMIKLVESLKNLLEKQKQLIDNANNKILEQQSRLNILLEDVKRKNSLLTDLLTTIKNKTYKDSLRKRIMSMKNSNISTEDMAKELNMTKGEIELIINLYEEEKK